MAQGVEVRDPVVGIHGRQEVRLGSFLRSPCITFHFIQPDLPGIRQVILQHCGCVLWHMEQVGVRRLAFEPGSQERN